MRSKRTRKIKRRFDPMKVRNFKLRHTKVLKRVFEKEVGDSGDLDRKLLVIAVHTVMIESGFVRYDSVSRTITNTIHVPNQWSSIGLTTSFYYTIPRIFGDGCSEKVEIVVLTFQRIGCVVRIKGHCLGKNMCQLYQMVVHEEQLVLFALANCDAIDWESGKNWYCEFLKTVKAKFALPLLTDLCEEAGLAPLCCLPVDLKLRILKLLREELKRKRKRRNVKKLFRPIKYHNKKCARQRIIQNQTLIRNKWGI